MIFMPLHSRGFMINRIITSIFVSLLLLNSHPLFAATDNDIQTWNLVVATGRLLPDTKFKFWLEPQQRVSIDGSDFTQTILRPGIGYELTPATSLWVGYAWIYTEQPFSGLVVKENRIWQQLLWKKSFNQIDFTNRLRLEERFFQPNTNTAWRLREFVKLAIPINQSPKLYLASTNELFFHLNNFNNRPNRGFDQNRFFIGLGYKFTKTLVGELGYLNQYIRRVGNTNFDANNIFFQILLNF